MNSGAKKASLQRFDGLRLPLRSVDNFILVSSNLYKNMKSHCTKLYKLLYITLHIIISIIFNKL